MNFSQRIPFESHLANRLPELAESLTGFVRSAFVVPRQFRMSPRTLRKGEREEEERPQQNSPERQQAAVRCGRKRGTIRFWSRRFSKTFPSEIGVFAAKRPH